MDSAIQFQVMILDGKGGGTLVENTPPADFPIMTDDLLCWVHVDYSFPEAMEWIRNAQWLDAIVKDNLLDDSSRPRSELFSDGLFLALRGVNLNPGSSPDDMVAVRMWATDRTIITSNRRHLLSLQDLRSALLRGKGPRTAADFATTLIESISLRTEKVIEELEDRLEYLEDGLDSFDTAHKAQLSDMRRQAIRLRRYLAPQQDALQHMVNAPPPWLQKNGKRRIREAINQFKRYVEMLDAIRDRAIVAQEELLTHLSETLNHRMYVLSLVTALFLPLGFLTGLFGINVGGIPGAQSSYGFLLFILTIVTLVLFLLLFFKKKNWL